MRTFRVKDPPEVADGCGRSLRQDVRQTNEHERFLLTSEGSRWGEWAEAGILKRPLAGTGACWSLFALYWTFERALSTSNLEGQRAGRKSLLRSTDQNTAGTQGTERSWSRRGS